jgi:hypothetical protein
LYNFHFYKRHITSATTKNSLKSALSTKIAVSLEHQQRNNNELRAQLTGLTLLKSKSLLSVTKSTSFPQTAVTVGDSRNSFNMAGSQGVGS